MTCGKCFPKCSLLSGHCTLASSQFHSIGTRPSCHGAHSEMNCLGCRHQLVVDRQESALPSRVEKSTWQLAHQLLKDALEVLPSLSVVCAIKTRHLPAKQLSQLHGAVEPVHPLVYWKRLQGRWVMFSIVSMCWFHFCWMSLKNNSRTWSLSLLNLILWRGVENLHHVPAADHSHGLHALSWLVLLFLKTSNND